MQQILVLFYYKNIYNSSNNLYATYCEYFNKITLYILCRQFKTNMIM